MGSFSQVGVKIKKYLKAPASHPASSFAFSATGKTSHVISDEHLTKITSHGFGTSWFEIKNPYQKDLVDKK